MNHVIDFQTDPTRYRHWKLSFDGPVATLTMDVDPAGGLFERLRAETQFLRPRRRYRTGRRGAAAALRASRGAHASSCVPARRACSAPAPISACSARPSHGHKVNFCKFTNETRLAIEDASENSGQTYLAAISGSAAGGGYELAVTADHIMLIDDRRSSRFFAGTAAAGGAARHRRPDPADRQAPRPPRPRRRLLHRRGRRARQARGGMAAGGRGRAALLLGGEGAGTRAVELAARSDRPADARGITLTPLDRVIQR